MFSGKIGTIWHFFLVNVAAHNDYLLEQIGPYEEAGMTSSQIYGRTEEVELEQGIVRYREMGEGPPILFVHGILVNGVLWREVVPDSRATLPLHRPRSAARRP